MSHSLVVDHVYTWVNSDDPEVESARRMFAASEVSDNIAYRSGPARIADNGELKASIEAALRCLPFVRNTYVFGNGARPSWLESFGPRVIYVKQRSVIPSNIWPTFQSDVVESYIHQIPGLSEHYIYSNDDFFFAKAHSVSDFFDSEGKTIVGLARYIAANGPTPIYRHIEENGVRALQKHVNLPGYFHKFPPLKEGLRLRGRKNLLMLRLKMAKRKLKLVNAIAHVSQPYLKSEWLEYSKTFQSELTELKRHRFRSDTGVGVNFLYHYYLAGKGKCILRLAKDAGVIERSHGTAAWQDFRQRLVDHRSDIARFCLNDNPVEIDDGWADFVAALANDLRTMTRAGPDCHESDHHEASKPS